MGKIILVAEGALGVAGAFLSISAGLKLFNQIREKSQSDWIEQKRNKRKWITQIILGALLSILSLVASYASASVG